MTSSGTDERRRHLCMYPTVSRDLQLFGLSQCMNCGQLWRHAADGPVVVPLDSLDPNLRQHVLGAMVTAR